MEEVALQRSIQLQSKPRRARQLSKIDLLATLGILILCLHAPAFFYEDSLYFNYVNNVQHPQVVYFYNGYIQLIPEVATYVLRFFPFLIQAIMYRAICLLIILLFYWQLKHLFIIRCKDHEASLLSLAVIFFLRFFDLMSWAVLGYMIWPAFLVASVYIIRITATDARYSKIGCFGILAASLSQPLAILLIPIFLISILTRSNKNRIPVGIISLLIAAMYAFTIFHSMYAPEELSHVAKESRSDLKAFETHAHWRMADLNTIVSAFVFAFRHDHKLLVVMIVSSVLVLVSVGLAACWRYPKEGFSDTTKIECMLSYLGLSSFAFYLLSPRFLENLDFERSPFQRRYEEVLIMCVAIASVSVILRAKSQEIRPLLFASVFGFCLALLTATVYPSSVTAAQRTAFQKYRFLMAAAEFRSNCRGTEAVVYDANDFWSLVVLCKPKDLPPGFNPVTEFKAWTTSDEPPVNADERPGIWSPTPLL
jgi:hypothetical protein